MNNRLFNAWVREMAAGQSSRRSALHAVVGTILGILTPSQSLTAGAKRRRRKRKKKKIEKNAFGCVDVGAFCQNSDQCCSGICEGKKGKKTCQAHGVGGCQVGDDLCADTGNETCLEGGFCLRTTGNASFCGSAGDGECATCAKDVDCETQFGVGAACIVCARCFETGGTACFPVEALS